MGKWHFYRFIFINGVSTLTAIFSSTYTWFVVVAFLYGASNSSAVSQRVTSVSEYVEKVDMCQALGVISLFQGSGILIGPTIGGNIEVHAHAYIYKYIYTYKYPNIYTSTYIHINIQTYIHVHIHIYIPQCIFWFTERSEKRLSSRFKRNTENNNVLTNSRWWNRPCKFKIHLTFCLRPDCNLFVNYYSLHIFTNCF